MGFDVHHVPGRIRFKVPGLRDDASLILALPRLLQSQDGVDRVDVRPASNSLIVHYNPARLDGRDLSRSIDFAVGRNNGSDTNDQAGTVRPDSQETAFMLETVRHLGIVFGKTAFKAALEQVVQGGIRSISRAASIPD
jgi:hypothetical protein